MRKIGWQLPVNTGEQEHGCRILHVHSGQETLNCGPFKSQGFGDFNSMGRGEQLNKRQPRACIQGTPKFVMDLSHQSTEALEGLQDWYGVVWMCVYVRRHGISPSMHPVPFQHQNQNECYFWIDINVWHLVNAQCVLSWTDWKWKRPQPVHSQTQSSLITCTLVAPFSLGAFTLPTKQMRLLHRQVQALHPLRTKPLTHTLSLKFKEKMRPLNIRLGHF